MNSSKLSIVRFTLFSPPLLSLFLPRLTISLPFRIENRTRRWIRYPFDNDPLLFLGLENDCIRRNLPSRSPPYSFTNPKEPTRTKSQQPLLLFLLLPLLLSIFINNTLFLFFEP
jgi:hypothetical protein